MVLAALGAGSAVAVARGSCAFGCPRQQRHPGRGCFRKASGNGRMVLIGGVAGESPSGGCHGPRIYAGYRGSGRRWGGRCGPRLAWLACGAQQKRLVVRSSRARFASEERGARSKGKPSIHSATEKGSSRLLSFRQM